MTRRRSRGLDQAQGGQGDTAPRGATGQDGQLQAARQMAAAGAARKLPDYESQLAEKDVQIKELRERVAEEAKAGEATQDLNDQIAAFKHAMADERVEFALISAGVRNVKAGKALLADRDGGDARVVGAVIDLGYCLNPTDGTSENCLRQCCKHLKRWQAASEKQEVQGYG